MGGPSRGWVVALAGLAAVRIVVPVAALAASGSALPGLPEYDYIGLTGDATGYYAATREFLASWGRLPVTLLAVLSGVVVATVALSAWTARSRRLPLAWLVVAVAGMFTLVVSAAVTQMNPPGAQVFGWPLVWSLPMLPYRALGGPLDPGVAYGFGLVLSLAANAVSIVATAYAGFYATGRRGVGIAAAAAFALWPLLVGVIGGERGWENGTWAVDAGLAMYTEPLSTALATTALALLLSPRLHDGRLALAGLALGLAAVVKLSNALFVVLALVLLIRSVGARRTLPYLAGVLAFAPLVAVYWRKGRVQELLPDDAFAVQHAAHAWADSILFGPRTLAILVPPAILGAFVLRSFRTRALLVGWIVVTAALYTFYRVTPLHPRFLFVALPPLFILWADGVAVTVEAAAARLRLRTEPQR